MNKDFKLFGYTPAAYIGVIEAFLALLLSIQAFSLTTESIGWIMAVVTAAFGLLTAFMTKHGQLSAIVGFAKAAIALGIGYGAPLNDVQVAAIIGFVTVVGGFFNHTQNSSLDTPISKASAGYTKAA